MNASQDQALQRFRRVKGFLDRETPSLAHGTVATHAQALGDVVTSLAGSAVAQDQGIREAMAARVGKVQALRQLLDAYMRPVSRIAGTLFPDDLTLLDALRMPKRGKPPQVVAAARAMANAVEPHSAVLEGAGFAKDFPDRMRTAATRVEDALTHVREEQALRSAATRSAAAEVVRGRRIVKTLDPAVRAALIGDANKLGEWQSLSRVGRLSSNKPSSSGTGSTPPPTGGTAGSGTPSPTPAPVAVTPVPPTTRGSADGGPAPGKEAA